MQNENLGRGCMKPVIYEAVDDLNELDEVEGVDEELLDAAKISVNDNDTEPDDSVAGDFSGDIPIPEYAEPTDDDDSSISMPVNEFCDLINEGRKELFNSGDYDGDIEPPEGYVQTTVEVGGPFDPHEYDGKSLVIRLDEGAHIGNSYEPDDGTEPMHLIGKPITLVTADPSGNEIESKTLGVCTGITAGTSDAIPTMDAINEMIEKYPDTTDEAQGLFRLVINNLNEQSVRYTIEDAEAALKTMKELMTHCRIELLKDQLDLKKVEDMSEIAIAMKEQSKSFDETANAIEKLATGDIFGPATPDEKGEVNDGEHSLGNLARKSTAGVEVTESIEDDIETLCDNMLKDIAVAKATFGVVFDWYNSSHKSTTVYDDILEKLEKDTVTIEASSDLNAGRKLKAIREVIDSIENRDSSFLLDSLYAKTSNPKRLREIGKESIKYGRKLYNNLTKLGFARNDLASFMNFFVTENQFRNIYNTGEQYINFGEIFKDCPKEELSIRAAKEMCAICFFFLYHIYKICEAEKKREYYLTIKYRLGIILVCDTNLKNPSKESTFRSRFEEPITEEPITETELSLTRSKLYDMYMPLLARYYEIMKDPTLMSYATSIARKKH